MNANATMFGLLRQTGGEQAELIGRRSSNSGGNYVSAFLFPTIMAAAAERCAHIDLLKEDTPAAPDDELVDELYELDELVDEFGGGTEVDATPAVIVAITMPRRVNVIDTLHPAAFLQLGVPAMRIGDLPPDEIAAKFNVALGKSADIEGARVRQGTLGFGWDRFEYVGDILREMGVGVASSQTGWSVIADDSPAVQDALTEIIHSPSPALRNS